MNNRILIVDDEENIVELIKFNLELKGYETAVAYNGEDALLLAKELNPFLIILDIMLPKLDGNQVCQQIRNDKDLKDIPVIMLTAKNQEKEKIIGLENGADDYMTKPFSIQELMARIKAVSRRYSTAKEAQLDSKLTIGNIDIDMENYEVKKDNQKIDLTLKEFELFKILAINQGKVLTRNYLLDKIWGYEYFGETRTVDVHIRHLRKKIEDNDKKPQYIETIRGVGYKLK